MLMPNFSYVQLKRSPMRSSIVSSEGARSMPGDGPPRMSSRRYLSRQETR